MINYPKNYAPLAEEEMEYTSGGLSINWMALGSTVMGLATSMLAYLNVSNIAGVAVQLQKKDPEKYPEPEGTINGNLIIDEHTLCEYLFYIKMKINHKSYYDITSYKNKTNSDIIKNNKPSTKKYIKSPTNYIGGKYKILPQILPHFPSGRGPEVQQPRNESEY